VVKGTLDFELLVLVVGLFISVSRAAVTLEFSLSVSKIYTDFLIRKACGFLWKEKIAYQYSVSGFRKVQMRCGELNSGEGDAGFWIVGSGCRSFCFSIEGGCYP